MSEQNKIRIVLAEDHGMVREGLRRLLESQADFTVIGEAANGDEALRLVQELSPDLLLLDVQMPRRTGVDVLREVKARGIPSRVLILTASIQPEQMAEALQLGAAGFVMKESASELLIRAVRSVIAGEMWIQREALPGLIQQMRQAKANPAAKFGLTARELDIIRSVVSGRTNREVAQQLRISEDTVKNHLTNIFNKLGVSNRVELALLATHHHLTTPDETP